jgi:hypothetical protein
MKRRFVRSVVLTFVLACGLQAIMAAPVLGETHRTPRPEPKRLWSTYPLDPRQQPRSPTKHARPVALGTRAATPPTTSNAPKSSFRLALLWIGLALTILAVSGAILVSFSLRPAWALGVAWHLPRPRLRLIGARQPRRRTPQLAEGEHAVNNLVHRALHASRKRHRDESEAVSASASETSRSGNRVDKFTPYSMRGRGRNKTLHQPENPTPESAGNTDKVRADDAPTKVGRTEESYAQVGEQVAAVLASAHQAAEQIRESARQEVERIRAEAQDKVAAKLSETNVDVERRRRESEKVRADADVYSKETRGAADRYVAETRMKIDKEAAQSRAEVDEQVRGIRRTAEQNARNLKTEALQRHKALVQEIGRAEARLQQLLGIFRGMTLQLEGLVSGESARRSGNAEEKTSVAESPVAESLDETLKPRRSPSRST